MMSGKEALLLVIAASCCIYGCFAENAKLNRDDQRHPITDEREQERNFPVFLQNTEKTNIYLSQYGLPVFHVYYVPGENVTNVEHPAVEQAFLVKKGKAAMTTDGLQISLQDFHSFHKSSTRSRREITGLSNQWGSWSCCRAGPSVQVRERARGNKMQFTSRQCLWDYCTDEDKCEDDFHGNACSQLKQQGLCSTSSSVVGFMALHCPKTCAWCANKGPAPTFRPTTEQQKRRETVRLRKVRVYFNDKTSPISYLFSVSDQRPSSRWKPLSNGYTSQGDVASFKLAEKPSSKYSKAVYFCKARAGPQYKWMISEGNCRGGWKLDFRLFASTHRTSISDKALYIANVGRAPWSSRVSSSPPCCGYMRKSMTVYSPEVIDARRPAHPIPPQGGQSNLGGFRGTKKPPSSLNRPVAGSSQPTSSFDKECLDMHNFYRALHNVPALTWNPSIAHTAKLWANHLLASAPEHPMKISSNVRRTSNWPHSERGTQYRSRGVGENIVWDLSSSGTSAKESVFRWYAEIFDYDKNNPTYSQPGKPVGHYTQLLWKGSNSLGCAQAVKTIRMRGYEVKTTYVVSHYAPGGNIRYRRSSDTLRAYTENVPDLKQGTCKTSSSCQRDGGCMGFQRTVSCRCARDNTMGTGGRPQCVGTGGCLVKCQRPSSQIQGFYRWESECMGQRSCECVYRPINGKAGAICS